MKKQFLIVGLLACSFAKSTLFAQKKIVQKEKAETLDEIVITATKFDLKKQNTAKVITKITAKQLAQNAGKSVIDILNTVAGIDVRGVNANITEPRSINIRGGRSRQVLVLIDGVPITDQSAINQEFDLRFLVLNQIESIEILKGASSTLYGSGAATAVINIVLKKATNASFSGSFESSLGTNNSAITRNSGLSDRNQNLSLSGKIGQLQVFGAFNLRGVNGMSSAKSKSDTEFETDRFYNENALIKLEYMINHQFKIATFFNFDSFDYDFDAAAFTDSDQNTGNHQQTRFGFKTNYQYQKGQLYLLASVNKVTRNVNQFNPFANSLDEYQFNGRSINLDLVNKFEFSDEIQLISGLNFQEHSNQTNTPFATIDKAIANFNTIDPYASLVYVSPFGTSANVGARYNIHNVYGNHLVYDLNVAHQLLKNKQSTIKIFSSYSTAFIAPSLYQLYDGFAGNIDLKPESNKTFEVGFDAKLNQWVQFDAVYFSRNEIDAIIYNNNTFSYTNGSSKANGAELNLQLKPAKHLTVNASYTHVNRERFEDFDDYIPRNKWFVAVDFTAIKNTFVNLSYRNVGERSVFDRYGSFGNAGLDIILPNYEVVNFTINHTLLNKTVTFFGAVHNLLNEDYDDILGFSTLGRNYKIGVRLQF